MLNPPGFTRTHIALPTVFGRLSCGALLLGDSLRNVQWNESTSEVFRGLSTSGHGCYRCLDALSERIQKYPVDRVHRVQGSAFDANSSSTLGCMPHDRGNGSVSDFPDQSSKCENLCFQTPRHRCRAWTATLKDCCRFTFATGLLLREGETVEFHESLFFDDTKSAALCPV